MNMPPGRMKMHLQRLVTRHTTASSAGCQQEPTGFMAAREEERVESER